MAGLLANLRNTVIVSFVLALIIIAGYFMHYGSADAIFWQAIFRWLHVLCGIMWIGLLYYFNFVQIPTMPKIPAELKPAVSKHIAPAALFWFRWAAAFTVLAGILVAALHGADYAANVFTFGLAKPNAGGLQAGFALMSVGIYLAIIMFLNVWGVIWPNQKKALGIVPADDAAKASAARIAGMASRINTMLSLPMLTSMAMYQTLFGGG